ncbi:uncharacterized protein [Palaemon carinicauda]|uniref:uncharacterized protein n=1 Tax=Palaemon carinicauda TaxID=392227 RepID=UPI0035B65D0B
MALNMDSFEFECCNSLQFIRISISPGSLKVSQNRGRPGTDASQLVFVFHPPRVEPPQQRVPGHVGLSGNEAVEKLAEEASRQKNYQRFYLRHGKKCSYTDVEYTIETAMA